MSPKHPALQPFSARLAALFILPLALLLAPMAHADPLDTVLDVLYKAGVIDGNVHAAKPLISCLASGKNAVQCTAGNAQQTELANDPQVQNVLDIYQSFSQHDWYAVLKKSGITVGCALIPGGQVKDVACGELGKIASQVLDGAGSVIGAVGGFITSITGGGKDPPPMSPQDYYTLNFMPWYHWSVVYQLDKDTPSNNQILNAPVPACVDYFYHHTYSMADAKNVCSDMRTWLNNNGYTIGNAFRDETDSYYQLHFAPAIEEAAENAFANNSNIKTFANFARLSCLADERKKIPLPEPGFEQCDAMDPNAVNPLFKQLVQQLKNQCVTLATQRSVPKDNDAYTRICTPIANRVSGAVIFRMGEIKSRMDAAAAAGCPNDGTPKSIHCDDPMAVQNCQEALPGHESLCHFNAGNAVNANFNTIFYAVNTADSPCSLTGKTIACVHTTQFKRCLAMRQVLADKQGDQVVEGIGCEQQPSAAYEQMKQQANLAVAALNAEYGPDQTTGCSGASCSDGGSKLSVPQASAAPVFQTVRPALTVTRSDGCAVRRDDPLVVTCPPGFHWDANAQRANAVYQAIGSTQIYCPPDEDQDGAEDPCLEGAANASRAPQLRRAPVIRPSGNGGG